MPVLKSSSYKVPFLYLNRHVNTVAHALLRHPKLDYQRERLQTADEDFVDLDFSCVPQPEKNPCWSLFMDWKGTTKVVM